ncbi:MAG: hypothetical protein IPG32_15400 [Saprospirales bacterium]|nr:hypothetical protein [Saprospirales bacterium]
MNRECIRLVGLLVILGVIVSARTFASANLEDPYTPDLILGVQDTIPIEERYGDFISDPSNNPFDLEDPEIIEQSVEYDPETGLYMITERIGDDFYRMPSYMTFDEYMEYQARQQEQAYFQQLLGVSGADAGPGRVDPIAKFDLKNNLVDRLLEGLQWISAPRALSTSLSGSIFKMSKTPPCWNDSDGRGASISTWPSRRMCRARSVKNSNFPSTTIPRRPLTLKTRSSSTTTPTISARTRSSKRSRREM